LPTILAVMSEDCRNTLEKELDSNLSNLLSKSLKVVGWTAFDDYAYLKSTFSAEKRHPLLVKLGINPGSEIVFHATQNVYIENNPNFLNYERRVTEAVFRIANDLGINLVVKPHPKEEKTHLVLELQKNWPIDMVTFI